MHIYDLHSLCFVKLICSSLTLLVVVGGFVLDEKVDFFCSDEKFIFLFFFIVINGISLFWNLILDFIKHKKTGFVKQVCSKLWARGV